MDINPKLQARLDQFAKLPPAGRFAVLGVIAGLLACGYFFMMYQDAQADLEKLHSKELELQRKLSEVRSIAANMYSSTSPRRQFATSRPAGRRWWRRSPRA